MRLLEHEIQPGKVSVGLGPWDWGWGGEGTLGWDRVKANHPVTCFSWMGPEIKQKLLPVD